MALKDQINPPKGKIQRTVEEVIIGMAEFHRQHKQIVLMYLNNHNRHSLFDLPIKKDANGQIRKRRAVDRVNMQSVNRLFSLSGSGVRTITYLHALDKSGAHFESMDKLIAAIKLTHEGTAKDRVEVLAYLKDPLNRTFLEIEGVNSSDVDYLFQKAGTGHSTLSILRILNAQSMTYGSIKELAFAVGNYNMTEEIYNYLSGFQCHLFQYGEGTREVVKVTRLDAEHILKNCNAYNASIYYMKKFDEENTSFQSLEQLRTAIDREYLEDRKMGLRQERYRNCYQPSIRPSV